MNFYLEAVLLDSQHVLIAYIMSTHSASVILIRY